MKSKAKPNSEGSSSHSVQYHAMLSGPSSFTDDDFQRLHSSVRPNPLSLEAFKCVVMKGQVSSHYTSVAMAKLAASAREILQEQGRLAEGAAAKWRGTKSELANQLRLAAQDRPGLPPRIPRAPTSITIEMPISGVVSSPRLVQPAPPPPAHTAQSWRGSATIEELSTVPRPTMRNPITFVPTPTPPAASTKPAAASSSNQHTLSYPDTQSSTVHLINFWSIVASLCNQSPCIAGYRPHCSPLQPIFFEMKRGALRTGCLQMQFELPLEHFNDVIARKTRVLLVPMTTGYTPHVWPKELKDLYLYVNGEAFTSRWKRSWSRKDLETSYLPIDITQAMDKRRPQQRFQFDCLAKDFMCSVAVVLAHQVIEVDLAEKLAEGFQRPHDLALMYSKWAEGEEASSRPMDDEDDVIEATAVPITTVCPISRGRLNIPVRGINCKHIQPINLAPYLRTAHTGGFFNCPKCDAPMRGDQMVIDTVLMKGLRELSIPRTWQFLQLQRRAGFLAPPPNRLLPADNYQWIRWNKDSDINGLDSEDESDTPTLSLAAGSKSKSDLREVITLD